MAISVKRGRGGGNAAAPLHLADKMNLGTHSGYPLFYPRQTSTDAYRCDVLDGIETHGCFTITECLALDHFGLTAPGKSWLVIENEDTELEGRFR